MTSPAELIEVLTSDPVGMSREQLLAGLSSAEELRSWIAAREGRFVRALDDLPRDPGSPATDTAGAVGRGQKIGSGQARKRARRAEQLGSLPGTEAALEQGSITDAHADVLANARSKADAKARAALDAHEAELLEHARREPPPEFARRVERFVQRHSDDDGRSGFDRLKARRRLSVWRDRDGMTQLRGSFDPVAGQAIRSTIERLAEQLWRRDHPDRADETVPRIERDDDQRRADALAEVCRRADRTDGVAKTADKAVVVLSYDDLVARLERRGISPTLADGTPIPASQARRLACDAGIIPVVLGGDSVPLDLGRAQRFASPAQKAGLKLQWATCSIADCLAPIEWTEAHHIDPFNSGGRQGRTDLDNLAPACDACHDLIHSPGWHLEKHADGSVTTTNPDGRRWHRRPNGPGVPDARRHRPAEPSSAAADPPGAHQAAATGYSDAA